MIQLTLEVRLAEPTSFTLRGHRHSVEQSISFPASLNQAYEAWQAAYHAYYQALPLNPPTSPSPHPPIPPSPNRGSLMNSGSLGAIATSPIGDHSVSALENKLIKSFNDWLADGQLRDIRDHIVQAYQTVDRTEQFLDLSILCNAIDLARLPWEQWKFEGISSPHRLRIMRLPIALPQRLTPAQSRSRPRILAVLGHDNGIDLLADRQALQSLSEVADIRLIDQTSDRYLSSKSQTVKSQTVKSQPAKSQPVKSQPAKSQPAKSQPETNTRLELTAIDRKQAIVAAIDDERGWDMLFFAGHSQQAPSVGGLLEVAPGVVLQLSDIEQQLQHAQQRGLHFAFFNSCNGIDLAEHLMRTGLSQVVIMREAVHNQIAQRFIAVFFTHLAAGADVYRCFKEACRTLMEQQYNYPSAALIPSLYRQPETPLFKIDRSRWQKLVKILRPTRLELVTLSAIGALSLLLPVQQWLLERRVLVQSYVPQLNVPQPNIPQPNVPQLPDSSKPPRSLLLVRIDQESIDQARISVDQKMDRGYLARLIDQLVDRKAGIIGLDYILNEPQSQDDPQSQNDRILSAALQRVQRQNIPLVIATRRRQGHWEKLTPTIPLSTQLSTQPSYGDADFPESGHYAELLKHPELLKQDRTIVPPLGCELALQYQNQYKNQYDNQYQNPMARSQVNCSQVNVQSPVRTVPTLLTLFSYRLSQLWLHPIMDYSRPPEQLYDSISAGTLLEHPDSPQLSHLAQQVVLIVPGGHDETSEDNFDAPSAMSRWYARIPGDRHRKMTGGEFHAYLFHQYLTDRFVIPIPDLWLILTAALLGKGTVFWVQRRRSTQVHGAASTKPLLWGLIGATSAYSGFSLLLYAAPTALLLPIVLPSATFWLYVHSLLKRN